MILLLLLACVDEPKPGKPQTDTWAPCTTEGISIPLTYAPTAPATMKEDDLGVVHIYAQNDADLFFAAGYEQGRQRLYQIDRARHSTRGTLSELDGESAVNTDITAHTFNFLDLGCRTLRYQAERRPADVGLGVAFTAGLNRYVEDLAAGRIEAPTVYGQDQLTYIPDPFTVVDVMAMGKRINLGYSNQLDYDVLVSISDQLVSNFNDVPVWQPAASEFIVSEDGGQSASQEAAGSPSRAAPIAAARDIELPDDFAQRLRDLAVGHGVGRASNNWVVSGAHTTNGKPMMANDPHASLMAPGLVIAWHLNSADAGGAFDVAGFSFPGVPGVHLGHNRDVNWSATNNFADAIDIFDVVIDSDGVANVGGEEVAIRTRDVTIRVLQADGSFAEVSHTVREVPGLGVVIPDDLLPIQSSVFADGAVVAAWAGFDPETLELFQYLDYGRAQTADDVRTAVFQERVGQQNWLFMDATTFGYQTHGLIPVRHGDPRRIQDASDPALLWTGQFLEADLFPALDDQRDFIGTANNAPFDHILDNDPTNDAFYYGSFFDAGWRGARIHTLAQALVDRGDVGLEDFSVMQADVNSMIALDLLPVLDEVASRLDTDESLASWRDDEDVRAGIRTLGDWNGDMAEDSEPAALFHIWGALLGRRTLAGDMGVLFNAIAEASPVTVAKLNLLAHRDHIESLLDGKGDSDILTALAEAVAFLRTEAAARGVERITWGDIHTAKFTGTFGDDISSPFSGDESTVNVADCPAWDESDLTVPCASHEGSIYRALVQFGDDDVPEMWFHVGHGGYGAPTDWEDFTYEYLPFRAAEVETATVRSWEVRP
jgi:penicillin amidase